MKVYEKGMTIIGPPGTGKTSYLIARVVEALNNGCQPEDIGYVSFTRAAIREATDRICKETGLDRDRFIGFRTLHSMAFWLSGLHGQNVIDEKDYLKVMVGDGSEIARSPLQKEAMRLFFLMYNFHRITGQSLEKVYQNFCKTKPFTEYDFLEFVKGYRAYKQQTNRMDFVDIIIHYTFAGPDFPFRYLFIDEAQDFTPDQWEAVKKLATYADTVYVAGDADQAIYEWAGVRVGLFDNLEGPKYILESSYRVPSEPHKVASNILGLLGRETLYKPRNGEGSVQVLDYSAIDQLPFDNGETWFVLGQTNHRLQDVFNRLRGRGVFAGHLKVGHVGKGYEEDPNLRLILAYNRATETGKASKHLVEALQQACDGELDKCLEEKTPWYKAFFSWPIERTHFYKTTQEQWADPKVRVGTFHSSKGAEADNVVLVGDCTSQYESSLYTREQEELRALYVAVTRTKNNLILLTGQGRHRIEWQEYIRPSLAHTSEL